jgi:Protein of unknown function (DUF3019)
VKNKYQFIFAMYLLSNVQSSVAVGQTHKDSIRLSLKPKECVVLKEGDKCYSSINVKWTASEPGSFCLLRTPSDIKLKCWKDVSEGRFTEDLVMDEPVDYYLVYADSSEILSREIITLSWVHKKSSRPEHTWRIF